MSSFTLLVAVCFIIIFQVSLFLFFLVYRTLQSRNQPQAQASQHWPMVMGTITAVDIQMRQVSGQEGDAINYFYPVIQYEYEVLGQHYHKDRYTLGTATGYIIPSQAQTIANHYIPGNAVRVYYNPNNPDEAVLEHNTSTSPNTALALGIVTIVLLLLCTFIIIALVMIQFINSGNLLEGIYSIKKLVFLPCNLVLKLPSKLF